MKNLAIGLAARLARLLPVRAKQALYRMGPLAGWIRAGLNRAMPQGLTPIAVAAGGLTGMKLALDLQTEKDYWLGTYEPELQAAIPRLVKPGNICYDIGANIGYIALLMARAAGESGWVYAFEALPANLERLRINLSMNGMEARVQVIPGAVTNHSGPVNFLVGPSGGMGKAEGSAGRREVVYSQSLSVPGISVDDFVYRDKNPAPQVIKLDIEGGEVLALPGMRRLLMEASPVILIELHGPEAAEAAWQALVPAGYRLCRMEESFPTIPSRSALDWKAYVVAIPADNA